MKQPSDPQDQCETCDHFNDAREEYELCAKGHEIFEGGCEDWGHEEE
jgi:hypothetical protein